MSYLHSRALTVNGSPSNPRAWRAMALTAVILLVTRAAAAQTNAEVNAGIQFDFSTPGARSLGGGGAFVARADDASAAYANPAGLTSLKEIEASAETRNWQFAHRFTDGGRLSGVPHGVGVDTAAGIQQGTASNQVTGLSFLSVVCPIAVCHPGKERVGPWAGRWTLALYRQELAEFRAVFRTQGAILDDSNRILPTRNDLQLAIVNIGFAAALEMGSLSVGAGISRFSFSLSSVTQRYFALAGPLYAAPTYRAEDVENSQVQHGDSSRVGFNVGLTWKPGEPWKIGATYRQGPRFMFSALTEPGPAGPCVRAICGGPPEAPRKATFAVPDVFGLGVSFQPTDWVTFSLEYDRVGYSALTSHLTDIFPGTATDLRDFHVKDSDQVHLGAEYLMLDLRRRGLQLFGRLGAWRDPDHRIRYDGPDPISRALFSAGADETHYSAGLGLVRYKDRKGAAGLDWAFSKFQLNAAFDYSEQVKTASLSALVYF
jgi:long-chain fatty acid transport protein